MKTKLKNWNYVPEENDDQEDQDYLEESDDEVEGEEDNQDISGDSRL